MTNRRVYLDYNATAPLRPEARDAMIAAFDLVGNPSSVHAEGRAARGLIERARGQVAAAFGADGADVIFTSGATEAAALACAGRGLHGAGIEHDAVGAWVDDSLPVDGDGRVTVSDPAHSAVQAANSETGVVQDLPQGLAVVDATQAFGKLPVAFNWLGCEMALISAHKLGGPKGIGALVMRRGTDLAAQIRGGGQEMGRRSGTENVIGIVGFGAAAEAMRAAHDASTPTDVPHGGWHTPYLRDEDGDLDDETARRVSAARCARVSYLTHDGRRDIDKDIELYDRLVSARPPHWSPLEHVATPAEPDEAPLGNFRGWRQLRHAVVAY